MIALFAGVRDFQTIGGCKGFPIPLPVPLVEDSRSVVGIIFSTPCGVRVTVLSGENCTEVSMLITWTDMAFSVSSRDAVRPAVRLPAGRVQRRARPRKSRLGMSEPSANANRTQPEPNGECKKKKQVGSETSAPVVTL